MIARTVLLAVLFISFTSCLGDSDNENECYDAIYVGVNDVTGPTTATINQPITLDVKFNVVNSCGSFQAYYEEATNTNEKTITVLAKYLGCDCDQGIVEKTIPYTFTATATGTYVLKFKITNTTFKTMTIVVT